MLASGFAQVIFVLEIHPELRAYREIAGKAQSRIRRDRTTAFDNSRYTAVRNANIDSKPILSDSQFVQKFRTQDFARMGK